MSTCTILVDRIKGQLKKKGITYAQLSKSMEVSESTLKRWFSTKNFSLSQLDQICSASGITLEELTRSSLEQNPQSYFTDEQEKLMDSDERFLAVFYLVALGKSFDEIVKRYRFTGNELGLTLAKLEAVGLLEVHVNNRLIPKVSSSTMWIPKGRLSQKYFRLIRSEFMDSYFVDNNESQIFLSGRLSHEGAQLIRKKIDKLTKEINEFYHLDSKDRNAKNISIFFGMRPWSFSIIDKYLK